VVIAALSANHSAASAADMPWLELVFDMRLFWSEFSISAREIGNWPGRFEALRSSWSVAVTDPGCSAPELLRPDGVNALDGLAGALDPDRTTRGRAP
jgi:hypothetical protein